MKDDGFIVKIRELFSDSLGTLESALVLMNRTQGEGLFNLQYLNGVIEGKTSVAFGGFIDDGVISVGCAEILSDFDYYLPFEPEISNRLKSHKVGSLCTLCVEERFQGKGIGQKMIKKRLAWLKERECSLVLGVSWLSGLSNTSDRVFIKSGFHKVNQVDRFFEASAIKQPFDCPGCFTQPCKCAAALYELVL